MSSKSESEKPSQEAIVQGNPAAFKPTYLVLDSINVDLLSMTILAATGLAYLFHYLDAKLAVAALGLGILPLRLIFPRPRPPKGTVLITGASSGVGAEFSYIFADKGHDLILVGRNQDQLDVVRENVNRKYQVRADTISIDLSLPGAAKELHNQVNEKQRSVSVLVNNAGLGAAGDTMEQDVELAERMTTLNCITPVQLAHLFGNDMIKRGEGWMLHVTSVGGTFSIYPFLSLRMILIDVTAWIASPGQNIYHATKHFLRAFSEALSLELRAYPGITNTNLMPGPAHTQFITRSHAEETFMMAASGAVEDPKRVASVGYRALCQRKASVFSSWNAAGTTMLFRFLPRSVHLTLASLLNAPLRGVLRAREPLAEQRVRGQDL
jgi:short-subunit dehydrogenase